MTDGEFDPCAVLSSLGYRQVEGVERVLGGWETSLWRFATPDGRLHALRVYPSAEHAAAARREEVALRTCWDAGVPVPAVEASGRWEERPALVLSWCAGTTSLAAMVRRPWSIWRLGLLFGRQQARIHHVAPPAALLEGAPDNWLGWVDEQPDIVGRVRGMDVSTASIIHLDYHPLNVLSDGRRISGVLDWPHAVAGDPRADLARTATLVLAAPPPPGATRLIAGALRRLFHLAWRRGYASEAGPVGDLAPFMAWAAATLVHDLLEARSRPQSWAGEDDLVAARRWLDQWKRRAGIP